MGKREEKPLDIDHREAIKAAVAFAFVVASCWGRSVPTDEEIDRGFEQADKFVASIKFK